VRIAFLASRKGYLKVMGSLIQAALDRGHQAILLTDPSERKPGEAATAADLAHWPAAERAHHRQGEPLLPRLAEARAQALVGPSLHFVLRATGLAADMAGAAAAAVRLYSVDYVLETLTSDPEAYRVLDVTFYATEFERRLHWEILADRFAAVAREVNLPARSAVCGSTMLDQLALVDRTAVRRRLGLPPDRPVVLLMSLKMAVPEPWRRHVWGDGPAVVRAALAVARGHAGLLPAIRKGNGYRELVEAVRDFCRRSGAALVVKSRGKNRDPRFLRERADVWVESDDSVFPYTSIELMAIADLCVHFQSGAVLEAAAAGVPSLSVKVPQSHLHDYPGHEQVFGGREGTLQNFAGVVWSAGHEEAAACLRGRGLGDFAVDAAARGRYLERFVGGDDGRNSHRVLDVIERGS
jgi:hypothetical protein